MSVQPPNPDDPLAALARAAEKAVQAEDKARAEEVEARESGAAGRRRFLRAGLFIVIFAILTAALVVNVPRLGDPYHGEDPLSDPRRAQAYIAALLDDVQAYRVRHRGALPPTLEMAVSENRLPPAGSRYRLDYHVEGDTPVLVLQGGREAVTMRGPAR